MCGPPVNQIEDSKEVGVLVDEKWCKRCKFFPNICQYKDNEGIDLSVLISKTDGSCQDFQSK